MRNIGVVSLALVLLGATAAPYAFVTGLFACMSPSDCAAMADLCDMPGMTSHDSCCHPSLAGDDSALPAVVKAPVSVGFASPAHSFVAAAIRIAPQSAFYRQQAAVAPSPPGSPAAASVLRI